MSLQSRRWLVAFALVLVAVLVSPVSSFAEQITEKLDVGGVSCDVVLDTDAHTANISDATDPSENTNWVIPTSISFDGVDYAVTGLSLTYSSTSDALPNIASLHLPETLTEIGINSLRAFSGVTEIVIPGSVRTFDARLQGMTNLQSVTFADGVEEIGPNANGMVSGCTSLTSVTLPDTLKLIDAPSMFNGAVKLESIVIPDGVELGKSVSGMFMGCTGLKEVTLPSSISIIHSDMFNGCRKLSSLTLKGEITEVGERAFNGCWELSDASFLVNVTKMGIDAFNTCQELQSVDLSSLESVPDRAFANCNALAEVVFSNSLKTIGESAFLNTRLTSLDLPEGLVSIGQEAFGGLSYKFLRTIDLPDSVAELGEYAFRNSKNIWKINIGSNLTSIPANAFPTGGQSPVDVYIDNSADDVIITGSLPDDVTVHYLRESLSDSGGNIAEGSEMTLQQAVDAAKDGETVSIEKNVTLDKTLTIPEGKKITITAKGGDWTVLALKSASISSLIEVEPGASVTFETQEGNSITLLGRYNTGPIIDTEGTVTLADGSMVTKSLITPVENGSLDGTGTVVAHGDGAFLSITGGTVEDNQIVVGSGSIKDSGVVLIKDGAKFSMTGGSISENDAAGVQNHCSSGVLILGGASGSMSGGVISGNTGHRGSAIMLYGDSKGDQNRSTFEITGVALVEGNSCEAGPTGSEADRASGAVHVEGNAKLSMTGGTITGNSGGMGAGVCVIDWGVEYGQGEDGTAFVMDGGVISDNTASGSGGGVYSFSNGVELNAGSITGNSAVSHGGGVYSEGTEAHLSTLHLNNAIVTQNTADQGGGMWFCLTGQTEVNVTDGMAVFGNHANTGDFSVGDDFVFTGGFGSTRPGATATLANRILGGGKVLWMRDGRVMHATSSILPTITDTVRFGEEGADPDPVTVNKSDKGYALHAVIDDDAEALAGEMAKLVISGNTAAHGGGIGANGGVIAGKSGEETEVKVNKVWNDGNDMGGSRPDSVTVRLYNNLDGKSYEIDSAVLSESNDWEVVFKGLPVDGDYTICEDVSNGYRAEITGDAENGFTITNTPEVLVTPANITIYMGGSEGYESVIESGESDKKSNSLPEPGFYLTLPDFVNDLIGNEDAGASDLSGDDFNIMFYEDGGTKSWKLEKYGASQSVAEPDENGQEHFIYRIVPAIEGQDPIRLEFTDPDTGKHFTSDEFEPNDIGTLNNRYEMGIYAGSVDQGHILMDITTGDDTYTLAVKVETGTLNVRYVTGNQDDVITGVLNGIGEAQEAGTRAYVVKSQDAKFYINGSDIDVTDDAAPSLLFDDVVSDHNTDGAESYDETLGSKAIDILSDEGISNPQYQAKYLDLVDANNGNAWLTTDKALTVYWPRPAGTDGSTKFYLVHFVGLDREMSSDSDDIHQAIQNAVDNGDARVIEGVANDPTNGVAFTLGPEEFQIDMEGADSVTVNRVRFSPFVLVWGTESDDPDPDDPPIIIPDDPDPSDPSKPDTPVEKELDGRGLVAGEFSFTITATGANAKNVSPKSLTGRNDASGNVTFTGDGFTFEEAGTYTFTVSEKLPSDDDPDTEGVQSGGVTYDESTFTVTAKVTKGAGGKLAVSWQAPERSIAFRNAYEPSDSVDVSLGATKVLEGRDLKAGEFTFELRDRNGQLVATAKNAADGSVSFAALHLTEPGTYTYTITEVAGDLEGVTYDTSAHTAVITVTDNGDGTLSCAVSYDGGDSLPVFTNTYEEPAEPGKPSEPGQPSDPGKPGGGKPGKPGESIPQTGDTVVLAVGGVAVVAAAAIGAGLYLRRRFAR